MRHLTFNNKVLKAVDKYLASGQVYNEDNRFFISGNWGNREGNNYGEFRTPIITNVSGIPWSAIATETKQRMINGHLSSNSAWKYFSGDSPSSGYMFKPNVKIKDTSFSAYIKPYNYYYSNGDIVRVYSSTDSGYASISQNSSAASLPSGNFPVINEAPSIFTVRYDSKFIEFPSVTNVPNMPYSIALNKSATDERCGINTESCWTLTGKLAPEEPVPPGPTKLTVDLNNVGNERTTDFQSQTRYPNVWSGMRVFETNDGVTAGETYHDFIKNLGNLSSNFTLYYWFAAHYASTSYEYGQVKYTTDNTDLISKQGGWTYAGQDSQQPWYDKSRYRTVEVDVSKSGDLDFLFHFDNDGWYGSRIYFAIDENLVSDVINPKPV